jgi:hypothetical protein
MSNIFRKRSFGTAAANRGLVECCRNIEPDFLVLGHAQSIAPATLMQLRQERPFMRIACWYTDAVYPPYPLGHLLEKIPYLDALFVTTAGDWLSPFKQSACRVAFIPNPADANIERWKVDEQTETQYDFVYIGSDRKRPARQIFLAELDRLTGDLRTGFAACLGRPPAWGDRKDAMLKSALTALNLSDRNDVFLYSSDRIGQLAGNGICTFSAASSGLDALYEPGKEMVFFENVKDLAEKIRHFAAHPAEARAIGRAGRIKTQAAYSGHAVSDFMCAFTFDEPRWKDFSWAKFFV